MSTAAAAAARQASTAQMIQRVQAAVEQIRREGSPATISMIHRRGGVSRSFLYQNPEARQLVTQAIAQRTRQPTAAPIDASVAPWRERALNAEHALHATHAEIRAQRQTLGQLMGRVRDLEGDVPADAVQHILSENTTLRLQARQLAVDNRTLGERLAAARDNARSQDTTIARLQVQLLEQTGPAARHLKPVRSAGLASDT